MFHKRFSMRFLMAIFYNMLFCSLGFYAHAQADDYSFVNALKVGFWEAQKKMYLEWSGRCANTFLLYLACLSDWARLYPFMACLNTLLNIAVFYVSLTLVAGQISAGKRLLTALLLQGSWFSLVPALNENFYWLCGMPYTWTAALFLLIAAMSVRVLREKKRGMSFALLLALVFFNGMILEQTSMMQVLAAFLFFFCFLWRKNRFAAGQMAFIFMAALCAFGVMLFSPGNAVRMSATVASRFSVQNIFQALVIAAGFGGVTALKFFFKPIIYVFLLFLPSIAKSTTSLDAAMPSRLRGWHIIILVASIAPFQQAIIGLATGNGLPPRGEGLAIWIMAAAWVFLWTVGYRNKAIFERIQALRIYPRRWALLAFCLVLNANFLSLLQDLRVAPIYAEEQRERESFIQSQKETGRMDIDGPLFSAKPGLLFCTDISPVSGDWKNEAYSELMGIKSISALPLEIVSDAHRTEKFLGGDITVLASISDSGDPVVQMLLAELYDPRFPGVGTIEKDYSTAFNWYRKAAENGEKSAQRRLSGFYARGAGGVPKSYFRAVGWLLRSQF
jgi:hypothetical protein